MKSKEAEKEARRRKLRNKKIEKTYGGKPRRFEKRRSKSSDKFEMEAY